MFQINKPDNLLFLNLKLPDFLEPITEDKAWQLTYQVALQGVGGVGKNPLVGAILVDKEHRYIEYGAHLEIGHEHAEANLLNSLQKKGLKGHLNGGILYVSLEPCAHEGKTPSCAKALAELPLAEVRYALQDPNPLVCGQGEKILCQAGIKCREMHRDDPLFKRLTRRFEWFLKHKTPYVSLKIASTLNSVSHYLGDERHLITGNGALNYGHWLRLLYDGILVGSSTMILDNPTLNVRRVGTVKKIPWRIVLDPHGRALQHRPLEEVNILKDESTKVIWAVKEGQWKKLHSERNFLDHKAVRRIEIPYLNKKFDLKILLKILGTLDITSLLIEGGENTWSSFLEDNIPRSLYLFQAPKIFLGSETKQWGTLKKDLSVSLKGMKSFLLEEDFLLEGEINFDTTNI